MFRKLITLLAAPAMLGAQQMHRRSLPSRRHDVPPDLAGRRRSPRATENNFQAITAANQTRSANNNVRSRAR